MYVQFVHVQLLQLSQCYNVAYVQFVGVNCCNYPNKYTLV